MKRKFILRPVIFVLALLSTSLLHAQSVAINTDGTTAHASAILDIKSSTKGMLAPRMNSAQRTAIATPAAGLFVYDTDTNSYWFYNGTAWGNLSASGIAGSGTTNFISKFTAANTIGSSQLFDNGTNIGINTASPTGKLHIKGSADAAQLIIDANATQSNSNPLIKLRNSSGADLMWIHSDHPLNTFVGLNAGRVNDATGGGTSNTFIGSSAGYTNSTGHDNTAIGVGTLVLNTTGYQNIALGGQALVFNTTGYSNTATGFHALHDNTTGYENTANGLQTLYKNTTGYANTANGKNALYENTTGYENTANGADALVKNTTGYTNTANGSSALYYNTTGNSNIANGSYALVNNTTASQNTAIGAYALNRQSFDNGGVAWESGNVAVGFSALYFNHPTSVANGIKNTAIGNKALELNTTGLQNTAGGYNALNSNTSGSSNQAFGTYALESNTLGINNSALGTAALRNNTIGNQNTAIGTGALIYNTGGSNNIAIGTFSGTISFAPNVSNTIGIGNDDLLNGSSNQVLIGNQSMVSIGGHVNWGVYSDARIKNTIEEDVKGLDFILKLRPVTYHISSKAITTITGNKETPDFPGKHDAEKIKHSGFLAQEVEQAAKSAGYDFSGYTVPKNQNELYTIRYAEFVVPLVKAVQELQAMIKTQQQQIDLLVKRIEVLEKK